MPEEKTPEEKLEELILNIPTVEELDNEYNEYAASLGNIVNKLMNEDPESREIMGKQRKVSEFRERLYGARPTANNG